jgi:hypothetical protein
MSAIDDVKKTAADLVGHFGSGRVSEYFQCFSESADFIFYTHTERLKSRRAYQDLWKTWESEMNFKVLSCTSTDQDIKLVGDDVAIFTHNVSTDISTNDGVDTVAERETIVFELVNGSWIAIHEHLSPAS